MSRRLAWRRRALADLATIGANSPRMADRIRDAVALYADQERGDVQKLTGRENLYRIRVGARRVIFTVEEGGHPMAIFRVLNRRDADR